MAEDLIPFNPIGSGKRTLELAWVRYWEAKLLRQCLADLEAIQRLSRDMNASYAQAMVANEVFLRQLGGSQPADRAPLRDVDSETSSEPSGHA